MIEGFFIVLFVSFHETSAATAVSIRYVGLMEVLDDVFDMLLAQIIRLLLVYRRSWVY